MPEIDGFLRELDLEKYLHVFVEHEVDLETLPALSDDDLQELGLPLGPRRKLQQALKKLNMAEEDTGGKISASGTFAGERRPVTILFADLCLSLIHI